MVTSGGIFFLHLCGKRVREGESEGERERQQERQKEREKEEILMRNSLY